MHGNILSLVEGCGVLSVDTRTCGLVQGIVNRLVKQVPALLKLYFAFRTLH